MDAFHALAEPRRRRIIEMLASDGELSATQISSRFDITPQAVSQHLKVLLQSGLLEMERRSQQHIYQINPESMAELERWLAHTRRLWSDRLDNLGRLLEAEKEKERQDENGDIMATAKSALERKRDELGFHEIGKAHGTPIYVLSERASASQSTKHVVRAKLALPTSQFVLSAFGSERSLRDKFNDTGKTDYSFWLAGVGKDTNHLVDESQESEITPAQEAEAVKLAESGMNYRDIAKKLGVTALSAYYALKKKGKTKARKSIKPRSSALCTFDKKGNLIVGKGDSLETTVRVSRGGDDDPRLFFVLRDSYSRVGGARFVIAACNGRQFTAGTLSRVVVGVPREA